MNVNSSMRDNTNNELISNILEMALNRIRSNNSDFSNAVLTRAHIRVRGKYFYSLVIFIIIIGIYLGSN